MPRSKTAAARVRAAAEFCIQESLTSLTALLDNSVIDCLLPEAWGESFQAEHLLSGFAQLAV